MQRKWVVENPLCLSHTASSNWSLTLQTLDNLNIMFMTSNNQRLGSAGDSDWRSKHFYCNAVFCVSFTWQTVKTRVIRLQEVEGQILHDQICVMCIPFILSGSPFQMLATYICDACIITTSRLGLGAPLVSHNQN